MSAAAPTQKQRISGDLPDIATPSQTVQMTLGSTDSTRRKINIGEPDSKQQ